MILHSLGPSFIKAHSAVLCVAAGLFFGTAAPASAADEATIRLKGEIPVKCEIGIGQSGKDEETLRFEVYKDETIEEALRVDCNLPVAMSVRATEGALIRQTEDGDGNVSRSEIDYSVALEFPSMGRVGPYNGDDLVSGVSFDSGDIVMFDEMGKLQMFFTAADDLPAGNYTEQLSITVRPIE